ncbi:MAG: phosphoribosyltransferase family protein [Candidatus Beckwithbacteria bacterium]|nr:phosphoribosyltransferase family protein [Candidatus Beckwithbacteria bacterium]
MFWLDWLYPKKCLGCGKTGRYFCESCLKTVRKNDQIALSGTSLFQYQGIIKTAIKALKYQFLSNIETELGELMDKGLSEERLREFLELKPGVQAMPLYWQRENWRGFNQAELIAKILAKKFNLKIVDYLERVKRTKPQADLPRKERLRNVKNIFRVKPGKLTEVILVVDDVWTTGATMSEAMKTLKKAGVKQVWGLTLAR